MRTKLFSSNQKGQATVEMALATIVFAALMLVLGDTVGICYNWVCLQYAVNEGARFGSLGKTSSEITNQVTTVAQALGVRTAVAVSFKDSAGGNTPGAPLTFTNLTAQTNVTLNPVSSVILQITGSHPVNYLVTAQALTRNEAIS